MKISEALKELETLRSSLAKIPTEDESAIKNLMVLIEGLSIQLEHDKSFRKDNDFTEEAVQKFKVITKNLAAITAENQNDSINKACDSIGVFFGIIKLAYKEKAKIDTPSNTSQKPLKPSKQSPSPQNNQKSASELALKNVADSEWLTPEIVQKVKKRLLLLSKDEANKELANVAQLLESTYEDYKNAQGEQKINMKKMLYNIIHLPGWGHVHDERDEYRTMSRERVKQKIQHANDKIKAANLEGTEEVTREMINGASTAWRKMIQGSNETEGLELPINKIGAPPIFCIDGPPGTGKTTIAKAVANALDMGFYDLSMAGKKDPLIVYGHGNTWGNAAAPGLVAEAQIKSKRERVVILLDEAEKAAGEDLPNALGQILEKAAIGYKDEYFEANIDKRKAMFVLTTNRYELLPEHIQSRVRKIYFKGYDDATKIKILKNMAVGAIGRLQESVQLQTAHQEDEKRIFDGQPFKGFKFVEGQEDVIEYIVQQYITEPGVREAGDLLDKIVSYASSHATDDSPVLIDIALVHKALKKPDPRNVKIKALNEKIGVAYESLGELRDEINQEFNKLEPPTRETEEKFSELVRQLDNKKEELLAYEEQIIDILSTRRDKNSQKHHDEHLESVKNIEAWTTTLSAKIKKRYLKKEDDTPQAAAAKNHEEKKLLNETEKRIQDLEKELKSINEQLADSTQKRSPEETAALKLQRVNLETELQRLKAQSTSEKQTILSTSDTTEPTGTSSSTPTTTKKTGSKPSVNFNESGNPSITLPSATSTDNFASVYYRLHKVQQKNSAGPKRSFEEFCTHAEKIIKKRDDFLKDTLISPEKIAEFDVLQEKSDQEKWLTENIKNPQWQAYITAKKYGDKDKAGDTPKYTAAKHFRHSVNTAYIYQGFTPEIQPGTDGKATGLTLYDKAREQTLKIERTDTKTTITSALSIPNSRDVQIMAEWIQQRCPIGGKCKLNDWESIPEEALRLFLSVKALGRDPTFEGKTLEAVKKYCAINSQDPLVELYNQVAESKMSAEHIQTLLTAIAQKDQLAKVRSPRPAP